MDTSIFSADVLRTKNDYDTHHVTTDDSDVARSAKSPPLNVYQLMYEVNRLCAEINHQFHVASGSGVDSVAVSIAQITNSDPGLSYEVAIVELLAAAVETNW
jgi:hypothetical protein